MRLLLDTHIAIWSISDTALLPTSIMSLLRDPENDVFVSAASIWEIAIKHPLGRRVGQLPFGAHEALMNFEKADYLLLAVSPEHAAAVETLPMHHADPFDRLLIAQSLTEPMRLVTSDAMVARYGETIMLV